MLALWAGGFSCFYFIIIFYMMIRDLTDVMKANLLAPFVGPSEDGNPGLRAEAKLTRYEPGLGMLYHCFGSGWNIFFFCS